MLDEIFGFENFLGEIVWYRYNKIPDKTKKLFFKIHDTILHYAKNKGEHIFNQILSPTGKMIKRKKMKKINGKIAVLDEYTEYERELLLTRSVIEFVPDPNIGDSGEKTEFETQKAEEIISLFILASSNPGDIVADFFCGSGTTLAVAEKLGRRWIGCDLSKFAIQVTRKRLLDIHNSKDLMGD
jgi:adenine-specific DNA-methyltransferase